MLRSYLARGLALAALLAASSAQAGVTVFQDPTNAGTPGAPPVTVTVGGPAVPLNLWYQTTSSTPSGASTACLSGSGDEVCGWDVYVATSAPGVVLQSFTPDAGAGSDVIGAISGNVLRANGGNPISGELGAHRIGTLFVSATATGSVSVSGNLYVNASLAAATVTTGNVLANAVTGTGDLDADGVLDGVDNCPTVPNGLAQAGVVGVGNQTDSDGDLVGHACDNCVNVQNARVTPNEASFLAANPWATLTGGQRDDDHDGYGNKCDGKFPGVTGLLVGAGDLTQYRVSNGKSRTGDTCGTTGTRPCAIFDLDEASTLLGSPDLNLFRTLNGKAPGPKCVTCPLACSAGTAGTCGAIP